MNNEHNIDDILKLLKESVERDSADEAPKTAEGKKNANLSEKKLKQQLRAQYGAGLSGDSEASDSDEYAFDRELLLEFETTEEDRDSSLALDEGEDEILAQDGVEEEVESSNAEELDCAPWEDPVEAIAEEATDVIAEESEEIRIEEEVSDAEALLQTEPDPEPVSCLHEEIRLVAEEPTAEFGVEEQEEYDAFPEIETIAMPELTQDFLSGETCEETEDLSALLSEETLEEEQVSVGATAEFCVNESIFDLMLQFGCQDELEEIAEDEVTEEFAEEDESAEDDGEYRGAEQNEEILADYRHRSIRALLRLLGIGAMAVLVFLYDTLPLFGVEFGGLIDYHTYFGSYLFVGLQFVLIAAVCLGRPMWNGIKRLVTIRSDVYSVLGVMVLYTAAYDTLIAFVPTEGYQPPVFHFVCVLWMLLTACAELVLVRRERRLFLVFSSDSSKFTLELDEGARSVAEKMYHGGIDGTKRIFAPASVSFPRGFFRSVRGENHMSNPMIRWILLPAVLLSLVAGMIVILLKQSLAVVCTTAVATLFAMLPCAVISIPLITLGLSSYRLTRRGIALTGTDGTVSYSDVDYLVFNDLHLFKKCETKDTGMVIYESGQTSDLFGCLQLLYAKIGGPMAKIFESVPERYRHDRISVRRIARNGIEAIIDRKHVLIVGDAGYLQRYGLSFPMNEEWDGRATLCVSLDGKVSAKISAAYEIEPIFEMLIERMEENGIRCVIETFDPMIHSAFVLEQRRFGVTPVSVVHKNAEDLRQGGRRKSRGPVTEILTLSSRLKLVEAAVWCKRLAKILRYNKVLIAVFLILGALMAGLCLGCGWMPHVNQYWVMLLQTLPLLGVLILAVLVFPQKNYFTLESWSAELVGAAEKLQKNKQRKANKGKKKGS